MASNYASCIKITDSSKAILGTDFLFPDKPPRDLQKETILANNFIVQNRPLLHSYSIDANVVNDGYKVRLEISSGDQIGALPLGSPLSGRYDLGMIIEPRFHWQGLGCMLDVMGWKVIPELQKLPLLPKSSRDIPNWVMSSIILSRLEHLLNSLSRKFELTQDYLSTPKGRIDWQNYAVKQVSRLSLLSIPCEFPALQDHSEVLSAVNFILRKLLAELKSQSTNGSHVNTLIQLATNLLAKVSKHPPKQPSMKTLNSWLFSSMKNSAMLEGLEAMEWSIENRGLAGLSDFRGLAWKMSMSAFFEAWVETIAKDLARQIGGVVKTGRQNETVIPIAWDVASRGTQKSLRPDVVILRDDEAIVIDAKFKSHWSELNKYNWLNMDLEHQEAHRNDLLQVLAYSTCFSEKKLKVCLVYPCHQKLWEELSLCNQLHRRASIYSGTRQIKLVLTAVPLSGNVSNIVERLSKELLSF